MATIKGILTAMLKPKYRKKDTGYTEIRNIYIMKDGNVLKLLIPRVTIDTLIIILRRLKNVRQ